MKKYIAGLFAVLLVCITTAAAQEERHFKFLLDGSLGYVDNINLREKDRDGRFVIELSPGFSFSVPGERSYFEFLTKLDCQNIGFEDYAFYPSAKVLGRYDFTERLSLGVWDTFQRAQVPGDYGRNFDINTLGVALKAELSPKVTGNFGYSYQYMDFDKWELAEYNQNRFSGGMGFALAPRTQLGVNLSYTDKDFNEAGYQKDLKTYTSYGARVKLEQGIASRSTLGGYVGYTVKDYKKTYADTEPVKRASESSDNAWSLGVYYNLPATEKTNVRFFYDRGLTDTYYIYPGEVTLIDGSPVVDVVDATYRDVMSDRLGFALGHRITERVNGTLIASYARNRADVKKLIPGSPAPWRDMEEDIYQIGLGLSFIMTKNLRWQLTYTYGARESNVRGDYYYNRVGFGINYDF